jgi:hypothetical protein
MSATGKKTLGSAIDEIVMALEALDESARATAVRAACEHLGLVVPVLGATGASSGSTPPSVPEHDVSLTSAAPSQSIITDIRTLKEQKQPTTAPEMACVVAYYLDSLAPPNERKKEVSSSDLEKYFKQGGFRLPKRMPQVLVNARASGYFDSAGHGKYKLNPVGHNLVVHNLPRTKK